MKQPTITEVADGNHIQRGFTTLSTEDQLSGCPDGNFLMHKQAEYEYYVVLECPVVIIFVCFIKLGNQSEETTWG